MRSRHLPWDGPDMAQPWKFHSLAVAVSSNVHDLGAALGAALVSPSDSPFRKNSASLPSMRLMKTRRDLPAGPTATSSGTPWRGSTTGDCFTSASQGYARLPPSLSSPTTKSRDLSSVPGKLITTGSLATFGSQSLSYSFVYFWTGASTFPSEISEFHSPEVNSSLSTSSSDAPCSRP